MPHLKVLTIGNNPNIILYTWRFQNCSSVDVYHVSDFPNDTLSITTNSYGHTIINLFNHFNNLNDLKTKKMVFDLIILSASSLQEISSLSSALSDFLDIDSKIFIESTDYVHLEPFVKMSIDLPQLKIYSLMTDYDFRVVDKTTFKQFNAKSQQSIYLGDSGMKSSTNVKYSKDICISLDIFLSLFGELFPMDNVTACNYSSIDFLSLQWRLAIPKICFDPLLILLEESTPNSLHKQVLAKPLISGLVTEIITVAKTMGARLPHGYNSENDYLSNWVTDNNEEMPKLLYHFVKKSTSLNIDILLLQPILLADDYGIKTPYLEFLYSMMCQFQKFNRGESRWFISYSDGQTLKTKLKNVSEDRDSIANQLQLVTKAMNEKERQFSSNSKLQDDLIGRLKLQIDSLQYKLSEKEKTILALQKTHPLNNTMVNVSDPEYLKNSPVQTSSSSTGTPDMKDLEDVVLLGISYGDSLTNNRLSQQIQSQPPLQSLSQLQTDLQAPVQSIQHSSNLTTPTTPHSDAANFSNDILSNEYILRERELDLRMKELKLQEREIELQKKTIAQLNPQLQQNHLIQQRKSQQNYAHIQKMPARSINGTVSRVLPNSANVIPETAIYHNNVLPQQFKKTSRKNRASNMPILRNASNTGIDDFSVRQPTMDLSSPPIMYQQRFNSMSNSHNCRNTVNIPSSRVNIQMLPKAQNPGLPQQSLNQRQLSAGPILDGTSHPINIPNNTSQQSMTNLDAHRHLSNNETFSQPKSQIFNSASNPVDIQSRITPGENDNTLLPSQHQQPILYSFNSSQTKVSTSDSNTTDLIQVTNDNDREHLKDNKKSKFNLFTKKKQKNKN